MRAPAELHPDRAAEGAARARRSPRHPVPATVVPGEVCRDHARASALEWLETNGLGGFAMGTVAGTPTRRYQIMDRYFPQVGRMGRRMRRREAGQELLHRIRREGA